MLRRLAVGMVVVSLSAGCGRDKGPPLQPGDVVRPQLVFAPRGAWPAGGKVVVGMLLEVHRPGRDEVAFLADNEVSTDQAVMTGQVTFWRDSVPLGDPLVLPFVRDC